MPRAASITYIEPRRSFELPAVSTDGVDPGVFPEAVAHEHVGAPDDQDLTRADLHVVRVLPEAGDRLDLGQVAHDRSRDRPEVRQRRAATRRPAWAWPGAAPATSAHTTSP